MDLPKIEKKIIIFWKKNKIFEKSLKKTQKGPKFVFYEGPPFANGLPGIHHLLARAFKDIILRYKTMQGFYVARKAGWDTHGLPTEMAAEKKLGIKTKREIEQIGIEKFIKECRKNVFTYKKEWEEFTERIGFWLDLKNAYITCSNEYIENLWQILKKIWENGFLYQDYKVIPYCPRCGTSLSSHEIAQGYKKVKENSVYVKFKIISPDKKWENVSVLSWTTTPWTLPGNVALAINPDFTYIKVKVKNDILVLGKARLGILGGDYQVLEEIKGTDLIGLSYQPLFNIPQLKTKTSFKIYSADFVTAEEGTGIVHTAVMYGEDDYELGKKVGLPKFHTVDEEGNFVKTLKSELAGIFVKSERAEFLILEHLIKNNFLFSQELYEHDYPFCWRCSTPLLYYAKNSWFIKMSLVKDELVKNNKKINWVPEYIKEGRFGEWLREVKDWNLSRERYWGTPLPIWLCQCQNIKVVGSRRELKKLGGKLPKDLHRPFIDKVTLKCEKCGSIMRRVPEVMDCWFDSGAMPFASCEYPDRYPADYICEAVDQTRGWFYTLLAVGVLMKKGSPYKNVISLGHILDQKGEKMSKSKGNIIWPKDVIDKFGADCARFYFYTVNQVGDSKRFNFEEIEDLYRKFFNILLQSCNFFATYRVRVSFNKMIFKPRNLLDRWIISRLEVLNKKVVESLDKYDIVSGARLFKDFVDDLSHWYIRRSRRRFQKPKNRQEQKEAVKILHYSLLKLSKLMAPFTPFIAEFMYQELEGKNKSVHLIDYPQPEEKLIDKKLEKKMKEVRDIIAQVLSQRVKAGIKIRQPLKNLRIMNYKLKKEKELLELIKEEVNVKEITFGKKLELDLKITPQLREEGLVREIIRNIQEMRKRVGLKPGQRASIYYLTEGFIEEILIKNKKIILDETKVVRLEKMDKEILDSDFKKEIMVDKNLFGNIQTKIILTIRKK